MRRWEDRWCQTDHRKMRQGLRLTLSLLWEMLPTSIQTTAWKYCETQKKSACRGGCPRTTTYHRIEKNLEKKFHGIKPNMTCLRVHNAIEKEGDSHQHGRKLQRPFPAKCGDLDQEHCQHDGNDSRAIHDEVIRVCFLQGPANVNILALQYCW